MPSTSEPNAGNVVIVILDDAQLLDFTGPFEVFSTAAVEMPKAPYAVTFTYTVGLTSATILLVYPA